MKYHSRVDDSLPIERRILNALIYVVHVRKRRPKAIYLTEEDYALFRKKRRTVRERTEVDGIPVRIGKRSVLYSDCWWGRRI